YTAADKVNARADAIEAHSKRLVYEVVLSEDKGGFKFGQSKIPTDMQTQIDELVAQLKANPNGGYIEVEGHTDNVGPKDVNYKTVLERAEAVKRYLYENQQIPLHKINVISYGEEKPIAPNKTKDGRAQNRRVVIKVLAYAARPLADRTGRSAGSRTDRRRRHRNEPEPVHRLNVSTFAGCFAFRPRSGAASVSSSALSPSPPSSARQRQSPRGRTA